MSVIKAFKGLRPKPEYAQKVASPPYDVLSSDEAREMIKDNPDSFLRVNKPEVDFEPGHNATGRDVYETGKKNLQRLVDEGKMVRDEKPCHYLYRLTWQGKSQTGLVTLGSCEEYNRNQIKKHEHTRPAKVADRADHMEIIGAQVGPVFCIFRQNDIIKSLFTRVKKGDPTVDFTSPDSVRHELWVVDDNTDIADVTNAFAGLPATYIADGHHRSAASAEVARRRKEANPNHTGNEHYNYFLNVIFPDDEVRILPYNRVVKGLNGLSPEELLKCAEDKFDIEPSDTAIEPTRSYEFGVYLDGKWYRLTLKDGAIKSAGPADSIDSAVLTNAFITPCLGIEDIRTDDRIDFVGGIRGTAELEKLVNNGKYDIAFSLFPVTVEQLLAVADANEVMPPKSTWFEPKLRSGMVINYLDE